MNEKYDHNKDALKERDCKWCHGKGWYMVPNGPDDVDKEPCEYCDAFEINICSLGAKPVEPVEPMPLHTRITLAINRCINELKGVKQ